MGHIHLRSQTSKSHPALALVALVLWVTTVAGAQKIDSLSTTEKNTEGCEWASGFHARGLSGRVRAAVTFDDGSGPALYVGGDFTGADDVIVNHIAKWDGESWTPLGTGMDAGIRALAVYDDGSGPALYVGGDFTVADDVIVNYIAKWDGESWTPLGTGMDAGIRALAVYDDGSGPALYAGGRFDTAGDVNTRHIAKWDGVSWTPLGTGFSSNVNAMAVYDDGSGPALYVGGDGFFGISPIEKWDGTSWTPVDTGIITGDFVSALTVYDDGSGSALYAGGSFVAAGVVSASDIAKWDGASWSPLGTGLNGPANALTVYDDGSGPALYAGGGFTTAGGVSVNRIAKWDGASWTPLGTGMNGNVSALTVYDDGGGPALYAGGEFITAGGVSINNIAKWDGAAWGAPSRVTSGNGLNGRVSALAVYDDASGPALYAGGRFTAAGSVKADRVVKWDGASWAPLGMGVGSEYSSVHALTVYDDGSGQALYAGGNFTTAGGVSAKGIAKWDGASWAPLGMGVGGVMALTVYDDGSGPALYAGNVADMGENTLAKWDGASWAPLGGLNGGPIDCTCALTVYDDGSGPALYAGGFYTLAKWDGVSSMLPLGTGVNDGVQALTVYDDGSGPALYAGGFFTLAGGVEARHIARWDGVSWTPLGTGMNGSVLALAVYDDGSGPALYAGGDFTTAGGVSARHIARWDGVGWTPLGTGMDGPVDALTVYDNGSGPMLFAGGSFSAAGGSPSVHIAQWSCPSTPSLDLSITKTNGVREVFSGATTTYTMVAANFSPVDAPSATLTDVFPSKLNCSWISSTTGSASGNTSGFGPALEDTLSLPAGSSVIYTVTCQIDADATGELTNTATIAAPGDSNLANDVAIDTDAILPRPDLEVTLTQGANNVITGATVTYGLVATNHGPSDAAVATLTADFSAELTDCRWQSAAEGGASGHTSGVGTTLSDTLAMPAGSSVTYIVTCAVPATASGALTPEATITSPADLDSANNTTTAITPVITRSDSKTVILTHFQRMQAEMDLTAEDLEELLARLHTFTADQRVEGLVIDVGFAADLAELYALWDADVADGSSNPAFANHVLFGCPSQFCGAEKQGLHDILREKLGAFPEARYLMLVGDDRIFPMARIRDFTSDTTERDYTPLGYLTPGLTTNTTVGQALARNFYLSDDPLTVRGRVNPEKLDRFRSFFLPDLAVGRLVETPAEILHSLDVFLGQDGLLDLTQLDPDHRVLVTGYDFLTDSGRRIRQRWKNAFGLLQPHQPGDLVPVDGQLVSRTWDLATAAERGDALLEHLSGRGLGRYGIMSLNDHATHHEVGVPGEDVTDIQGLSTAAIDTLDLTGSVIYAAGSHGGLPVAGKEATAQDHPLDLPQTFLRRGVMAYVANSGFGWGLLHNVGYSERMVEIVTEELSRGGGEVTIGDAVRTAKTRYFLEDLHFDVYDIKTSMQWTLFGFPMAAIHTGLGAPAAAAVNVDTVTVRRRLSSLDAAPPHLISEEEKFPFTASGLFTKHTATGETVPAAVAGCPAPAAGEPAGCYYTLNGLATGEGDLPIEPFFIEDSRLAGTSQHGVLWKGGSYKEETGWIPVFSQPVSNGGSIDVPGSLPRKTFIRPRGRFRRGSLTDPSECRPTDTEFNSIVFSPAELVFDEQLDPTIHRLHHQVDLEVLYYNNTQDGTGNCDRTGPQFSDGPYHTADGTTIRWTVPASDPGGVWRVMVVYDDEVNDRWVPLELAYDASIDRWQGELTLPEGMNRLTYFLQAADNRGNVSWADFTPTEPPASGIDSELPQLLEAAGDPGALVFTDGFESGDCSVWSSCY